MEGRQREVRTTAVEPERGLESDALLGSAGLGVGLLCGVEGGHVGVVVLLVVKLHDLPGDVGLEGVVGVGEVGEGVAGHGDDCRFCGGRVLCAWDGRCTEKRRTGWKGIYGVLSLLLIVPFQADADSDVRRVIHVTTQPRWVRHHSAPSILQSATAWRRRARRPTCSSSTFRTFCSPATAPTSHTWSVRKVSS